MLKNAEPSPLNHRSQLHAEVSLKISFISLLDDTSKLLPWQFRWFRNNNCSSSEWNTVLKPTSMNRLEKKHGRQETCVPSQDFHYQFGFNSISTQLNFCVWIKQKAQSRVSVGRHFNSSSHLILFSIHHEECKQSESGADKTIMRSAFPQYHEISKPILRFTENIQSHVRDVANIRENIQYRVQYHCRQSI